LSPRGTRPRRPARRAGATRVRSPLWARLLVILGSVLAVLATGTIITERVLVAAATSGIRNSDLLGGAGNQQAAHHVEINGPLNVLLIGIDERPNQPASDPFRADSIIVLHVPAAHDKAYLISIPRDSYVAIPPDGATHYKGGHDKINNAYAIGSTYGQGREGGARLLAATVKQLTGTGFDGAAIINFGGFQQVVAALGGVTMCVDEETVSVHVGWDRNGNRAVPYDQSSGRPVRIRGVTPQVYHPGCQPFNDWQALDYVRQRELLPDGDYGRQRHQQQFLKAVLKQALNRGLVSDPGKLRNVINAAGQALTLDLEGVGIDDWLYSLRRITPDNLVTIRSNGGQFANLRLDGVDYERVIPETQELLRSTATDTVGQFLDAHPSWLVDPVPAPAGGSGSAGPSASPATGR
jgi:LCP family protein required for cell wall assembly